MDPYGGDPYGMDPYGYGDPYGMGGMGGMGGMPPLQVEEVFSTRELKRFMAKDPTTPTLLGVFHPDTHEEDCEEFKKIAQKLR